MPPKEGAASPLRSGESRLYAVERDELVLLVVDVHEVIESLLQVQSPPKERERD